MGTAWPALTPKDQRPACGDAKEAEQLTGMEWRAHWPGKTPHSLTFLNQQAQRTKNADDSQIWYRWWDAISFYLYTTLRTLLFPRFWPKQTLKAHTTGGFSFFLVKTKLISMQIMFCLFVVAVNLSTVSVMTWLHCSNIHIADLNLMSSLSVS